MQNVVIKMNSNSRNDSSAWTKAKKPYNAIPSGKKKYGFRLI